MEFWTKQFGLLHSVPDREYILGVPVTTPMWNLALAWANTSAPAKMKANANSMAMSFVLFFIQPPNEMAAIKMAFPLYTLTETSQVNQSRIQCTR